MKKHLMLPILIIALLLTFSACGKNDSNQNENSDKITIIATTFPQYDWIKNILGENINNTEVTLLQDKGVDLHSFEPTAEDILEIGNSGMLVYVGGVSDEWIKDAVEKSKNESLVTINLMDVLGDSVKQEETKEGMQHGHEDVNENDQDSHPDEHIWLSLKNAQRLTTHISEKLGEIDAQNADLYEENAKNYNDNLATLDKEYEKAVAESELKTLVFGDRFPFRYLLDDYNLDYYAAFSGCSAETEASFETIIFLADKIDELGSKSVITIDNSDKKIAETIVENTERKNQQILTMDSMQSVTSDDINEGANYIDKMRDNLEVVKKAI